MLRIHSKGRIFKNQYVSVQNCLFGSLETFKYRRAEISKCYVQTVPDLDCKGNFYEMRQNTPQTVH